MKIYSLLLTLGLFRMTGIAQEFEAAAIRRHPGVSSNTNIRVSGGRLTIVNASVKTLIRNAYGILSFQLVNEPRWLDSEMFDVSATTGSSEEITQEQMRVLLQTLLADRFGLKVHRERRTGTVYALVIAPEGAKLVAGDAATKPGVNTRKGPGEARMKGTNEQVAALASNLGNQLGRFVLDQTGLTGGWDWDLVWDPDPGPEATRPSLFTAVRQQLGLRLEPKQGPMEVLVIDSVGRPSEN